jgi:hypothetical protein
MAGSVDQRSYFTIEGSFNAVTTTQVAVSARIARLGPSAAGTDLTACFLVINDTGLDDHHFVVWGIGSVNLPAIDNGEIYQVPAQTIALARPLTGASAVIVCIKDARLQVLQAILLMGDE